MAESGSMHIEIEDGRTYIPSSVPYLNYLTAFCFADAVGKTRNVRFYVSIITVSVLDALTHYYCIAYLVITCFVFGIYLLYDRKYKEFGLFACSMAGAGGPLSILPCPILPCCS